MKDSEIRDGCFAVIGALVIVVLALIFGGTIGWLCGFAGGWLLEQFIGGPVTDGLNIVLGNVCSHVFVETDIPYVMATLGLIGGCLCKTVRSSGSSKKKDRDEAADNLTKSIFEAFGKKDFDDEKNE